MLGPQGRVWVIPLRLKLENFLSYRDAVELDLQGVEVACLCGDNGHGKTALLDAMTWALWGGARGRVYGGPGGGSPDELVHQGRPEMSVELDFLVEDARYRVVRKHQAGTPRRSGTSHWDLQVWTGSEYLTLVEGAGVRDTAERIERLLRMDYETFVRSAFLLQGQADRFTASRPAERKETLAEILGLSLYESLERRAREAARDGAGRIARIQGEQENLACELDREAEYREALAAAQAALEELTPHVSALAARRAVLQEERHRLESQREEAQRLDGALRGALQQVQALEVQAQEARRRVEVYRSTLARRPEIETGASERESVLQRLEALEVDQASHAELVQQRQGLQHRIAQEQTRLEAGLRHLQQRVQADLLPRSQRLPQVEAELEASGQRFAQLQAREAAVREERQRLQGMAEETQRLEVENATRRAEMDELRKKLDMLTASDAACPLCEAPLGPDRRAHLQDEIEAHGKAHAELYRTNRRTVDGLVRQRDELQRTLEREEATLAQESGRLQAQRGHLERELEECRLADGRLAAAMREAQEFDAVLQAQGFAQEQRRALADVEARLAALGYDAAQHRDVRARAGQLEAYRDLAQRLQEASERLPQEEKAALEMEGLLEARRRDARQARERIDAIGVALERLPALEQESAGVEAEHLRLETQAGQLRRDVDVHTLRLEDVDRARQRLKELEAQAAVAVQERGAYEVLVDAFGRNGVPARLIEAALPDLESEANEILARLSDGRLSLFLETQRTTARGDVRETLDIRIHDGVGTRSYELFSGGEAFRINFALRIALAKLLATRAGAPLRTLFLDEGFGTQDAQGRQHLLDAIRAVQRDFDLILVITHIDELKEAFPVRIEVTRSQEEGSTFQVVWS